MYKVKSNLTQLVNFGGKNITNSVFTEYTKKEFDGFKDSKQFQALLKTKKIEVEEAKETKK